MTNDAGALAAAGSRASAAAVRLADGFAPSAGASADRLRGAAGAVASERSGVDLAVEASTARAAALAGAYETVLAATRARRPRQGRGVAPRPRVQAGHPLRAPERRGERCDRLARGRRRPPRACRALDPRRPSRHVRGAPARGRSPTPATRLRAGLPEKAARSAATARGYWWILRGAFAGQRGEPAAAQLDRAFERLVGAARTGKPAATAAAAATIEDDLLAFRAAPLSASEQARRAGQLIRYLGLVPVEYGRGVANGSVVVPIEIQEAIAFRDGAAVAFGELQSYLAARDLAATRSVQRALAGLDTRLGDAERGTAVADPGEVESLTKTATSALDDVYPDDWKAGTAEADFDVIATLAEEGVGARGRRRPAARRVEPPRGVRRPSSSAPSSASAASRRRSSSGSRGSSGTAPTGTTASPAPAPERERGRARGDDGRARSRAQGIRRGDRRAGHSPARPSSRTARSSSSGRGSRRCSSSPR